MKKLIHRTLRRAGYTMHSGPCERSFIQAAGQLLDYVQPSAVLDVGACVGEYAVTVRNLQYAGPIHSFEPMPENFRRLAARAQPDPLWSVHPYALGDTDTEAQLLRVSGDSCHSFHSLSEYGAAQFDGIAVEDRVTVPVRRLDAVWPQLSLGRNVWLKCDTQGHDLAVISGAGRTLDDVAVIQVEMPVHPLYEGVPTFGDMTAHLAELGFEPWAFEPVNLDARLRVMEFDGLFVRH